MRARSCWFAAWLGRIDAANAAFACVQRRVDVKGETARIILKILGTARFNTCLTNNVLQFL